MTKKRANSGSDYFSYKVSDGGIQLQLIESTRELVTEDFLMSVARYCDKVSATSKEPLIDVHEAKELWLAGEILKADKLLAAIGSEHPEFLTKMQYLIPAGGVALEKNDLAAMKSCLTSLEPLTSGKEGSPELLQLLKFVLVTAIYSDRNLPVFTVRLTELKAKLQHANLMGVFGNDPNAPHLSADPNDVVCTQILEVAHAAKQIWVANRPIKLWRSSGITEAKKMIDKINNSYPVCWSMPQFLLPAGGIAIEMRDMARIKSCLSNIEKLTEGQNQVSELLQLLRIALVLAISSNFKSPDFKYRFRELKSKLEHASLVGPLTTSPLMPEFRSKSGI
jgi:hypothetical protein